MDSQTLKFITERKCLDRMQSVIIREKIKEVLNLQQADKFPGAQPVSLEPKSGLSAILREPFQVCEKTDGTRFLLYISLENPFKITNDETNRAVAKADKAFKQDKSYMIDIDQHDYCGYLIDRDYRFMSIKYSLDLAQVVNLINDKTVAQVSKFLLLLDGELVTDVIEGKQQLSFYLFDCLYSGYSSYMQANLTQRLNQCTFAVDQLKIKILDNSGVVVKTKLFLDKMQTLSIKQKIDAKEFPHESDGIIFTAEEAPYVPGTTTNILKWKPRKKNSVDLAVELETENCYMEGSSQITSIYRILFYVNNRGFLENEPIQQGVPLYLEQKKFDNLRKQKETLENVLILEVYWDQDEKTTDYVVVGQKNSYNIYREVEKVGKWVSMKIRKDKKTPNDRRVYDSVLRSYDEFLDLDEIQLILEGKKQIPGVCRKKSPFELKKLGYLKARFQIVGDEQ